MVDINCESMLSKPILFTNINNNVELKKREIILTIIKNTLTVSVTIILKLIPAKILPAHKLTHLLKQCKLLN